MADPLLTPRHPFRARLDQRVLHVARGKEENDLKLFALSFTAFFICFYTFLM